MNSPCAEYRAGSASEIEALGSKLKPGDVVILKSGQWKDQVLALQGNGTKEKPITFRAELPGKTVLAGESSVSIDGENLVVSGLHLKDAQMKGDGIKLAGSHNRLTDTAVTGGAFKFFVHVFGTSNRMDHCYLADKTSDSPTLQIEALGQPNHHQIDYNHFGPRPPLGRNGGETIRVGYSGQSMSSSATVVEHNLFDRCDGEIEIISSKSCDNVYRFNTFLDCAGMLTLRHGNRCTVEANFIIAHNKRGSGGIRVIGEDHVVINNYIEGVEKGGFWITSGIPNSPLNAYFQARNCLIAFNTFVDSPGPALELDAGMGTANRTLRPERITIANNLFVVKGGSPLKGKEGADYKWLGNIIESAEEQPQHDGIRYTEAKLVPRPGSIWRLGGDSPARGAAVGDFPRIKTDIDGQERKGPLDVGCDQDTEGWIKNRPLTAGDVGPEWLDRSPAEQ